MKKKTKWIIGIGCGSIFLFFIIAVVLFFMGFFKDKENTRKEMIKIQDQYVLFKASIESYNEIREKVYTSIFNDLYYNTMEEKSESNQAVLKEAEKVVEKVEKTSKSLKKACLGVIYPDVSVNTKCSSFAIAYEQVVNSYVSDVEQYNQQIKAYNTWAKKEGKNILSPYQTNQKYLDYNQDKTYSGKEKIEDGE